MKQTWYHCGHCGSLFASGLGPDGERLCAECGRAPGTGVWPTEPARPPAARETSSFVKRGETLNEGGQFAVRKKRKKSLMTRVVVVWLVIMSIFVWMKFNRAQEEAEKQARLGNTVGGNLAEGTLADERVALLTQALPECHRALAGFLAGGTPEIRNKFVADPIDTAGKMATFYRANPFPDVDLKDLRRIQQEPIRVGDEWMIETRWQGAEGVEFDAVFRREGTVWKLDWEHFSRYGDFLWPLFLAGQGPDEAEFRLLARKSVAERDSQRGGSRLPFFFVSPVFGKPGETGMASPEFILYRRSYEGILIEAAFDARQDGRVLFGSGMEPMEPDDLVRLRVRIKRGEFGGVRSFSLEKVLACHWIDSDEVGIDLDKLKDELFGTD